MDLVGDLELYDDVVESLLGFVKARVVRGGGSHDNEVDVAIRGLAGSFDGGCDFWKVSFQEFGVARFERQIEIWEHSRDVQIREGSSTHVE
jgi:hypothetical protein